MLEYNPLVIQNEQIKLENGKQEKVSTFKVHVGNVNGDDSEQLRFQELDRESIITSQIGKTKIMVCITMFNEPFSQVLESLAGIYRAYYELCERDIEFEDKFSIVIVSDGFPKFNEIGTETQNLPTFAESLEASGLYKERLCYKYFTKKKAFTFDIDKKMDYEYSNLEFIKGNDKFVEYETHNLAHCFSRKMLFSDFLDGMTEEQRHDFRIENYDIVDFMLGNSQRGKCKYHVYHHLPIDVHFVIKHKNRGKIESHLWFFKGFCETIKPEYCFIIDAGTIPLWNSMSRIVFHMEANKQIGGACGEIEVMLPEKNSDGSAISFIESILIRAQYVEYKISHYLDKATESLFGFVSVLPGAFSAFRWDAIRGEPLQKFLKGQSLTDSKVSTFPKCWNANMYLAEDRIM